MESKMKYYQSNDLHTRLHTIKQGLLEKAKTHLNEIICDKEEKRNYVRVHLELWYNNKRLDDIYNPDIEGFVLKDEKPAVYQVIRKAAHKNAKEIIVIGVWEIKEIVYRNNKDFLGIGGGTFTFNTYEDLLKFVDASLREEATPNSEVRMTLFDRKTDIPLSWMLESYLLKEDGCLPFNLTNLDNLNDYQKLSDENKKLVDEFICPILLDNKSCTDVTKFGIINSATITVNKEDVVNKNHRTNVWDEYIASVLSTENKDKSTI